MNERSKFVFAYEDGLYTISELCDRFGISRKTGYKWLQRYKEHGLEGLQDQSRAPKSCPHKTDVQLEQRIVAFAGKYKGWGPRKIRSTMLLEEPTLVVPSICTFARIMDDHGLVTHKRRRRHWKHPGTVPLAPESPNAVWSMDFKGEFTMGNGVKNYPLTVTDSYSRFFLCCHGFQSTAAKPTLARLKQVFWKHGLPDAIRTDNGVPFVSPHAICGLSQLSVYLIKLGISHQRMAPGHPEQNPRHERVHRDVKQFTTRPPAHTFVGQQKKFDHFVYQYNYERPHESLNDERPADHYQNSTRALPKRLPQPQYAGHWDIRLVSENGTCKLNNHEIFISSVLAAEYLAFEEVDNGVWSIYFYDRLLARFDERDHQLKPASP